ncbi:MAG: glutathione S-transferase family protein [Polyangiales bacterium]
MNASPTLPRLYHASPSYYSQIARLALVEAGIAFESHPIDIHRRRQNIEPDYVRMNPNMTVPTLVVGEKTLIESRDIVEFALGATEGDARRWVDRQYAFPIEELTFGKLLSWNPIARAMIPRTLAKQESQFRALAAQHPELASLYLRRAEVFAERVRTFDPARVAALWDERIGEARAHLDALEGALADGRATLIPAGYGPADVVWTVFLARLRFVHVGEEIARRPAVLRYAEAMFARPSFAAADVWTGVELMKLLHAWFD